MTSLCKHNILCEMINFDRIGRNICELKLPTGTPKSDPERSMMMMKNSFGNAPYVDKQEKPTNCGTKVADVLANVLADKF